MVSTDGPTVTPDDGEPGGKKSTEQTKASPESRSSRGSAASAPTSAKQGEENVPVARKLTKEQPSPESKGSDQRANGDASKSKEKRNNETENKAGAKSPGKRPKPQKLSRRQKKINRLVMEFQPDAVEMEHRKVAGGLRWTLYVSIALLTSAIAWAYWAKVDRVVTAEGKLISVDEFVIEAPSTSPIRTIEAKFGDTVKAGQTLVTLDPTFSEADVAKLETRQNSLQASVARLTAEQQQVEFQISGHEADPVWLTEQMLYLDRQRELNANKMQYEAEYRKLLAQKARNEADVQSRKDLVELRQAILKQSVDLRRTNSVPKNEVMQNQAELKYANGQLITAENTVLETEADFAVLDKQRESRLAERMAQVSLELAQVRQNYNEVVEDLNKARFADEMVVIRAPNDFAEYKVVEIVDRNSVVKSGQPIMRLIPVNAELEVEIKVENKDIAVIRNTQDGKPREVKIKLAAYPFMKHGTITGTVKTINEDITEEGQPGMTRAYYTVRISLPKDAYKELTVFDSEYATIQPGMAATADIKVGTRRVLDYFLYPLMKSVETSIREP